MRIFRHFNTLPSDARGAAVAIGNFDGVHPGHRAVIKEAGLIAHDAGLLWAVLTFEPHPRELFQPNQAPFRLTPLRSKAREIAALGVDMLIVQRFDEAFSCLEAEDFVKSALARGIEASHVVSGYDFVFGHGRGGTCEMLLSMGAKEGFGFTAVNAIEDATGEVYSSTRIRERLTDGDPRGAAEVLGRPFELEGRVVEGERRGHALGFPTANIGLGTFLRPTNGIYAVRAAIDAGPGGGSDTDPGTEPSWRDGVANIGVRPTFGAGEVLLEVYLFDFDQDLYGRRLRVRLVDFLREEKKFDDVDELKAQIASDSVKARQILAAA